MNHLVDGASDATRYACAGAMRRRQAGAEARS